MKHWTHKYRYVMRLPRPDSRTGSNTVTGTIQVDRTYSKEEAAALIKTMNTGLPEAATLCNLYLVELRTGETK